MPLSKEEVAPVRCLRLPSNDPSSFIYIDASRVVRVKEDKYNPHNSVVYLEHGEYSGCIVGMPVAELVKLLNWEVVN